MAQPPNQLTIGQEGRPGTVTLTGFLRPDPGDRFGTFEPLTRPCSHP